MRCKIKLLSITMSLLAFSFDKSVESCLYPRGPLSALTISFNQINCYNISLDTNLSKEIYSVINNSSIRLPSLNILNSIIPDLNQNFFKGIHVTQIKVEADVRIIRERAFENCNFSIITLDNNYIQTIEDNCFNSSALEELSLYNNSLESIHERKFVGADNLQILNLGNNRIVDIHPNAFEELRNLKQLDLSYNLLASLPSEIFRITKNLKRGSLNYNNLKSVNLNHNYLGSSLSEETFRHLRNLSAFDLSYNGLTEFNVNYINELGEIDSFAIAGNNLTDLDFSGITIELKSLNISDNVMKNVKNLSLLKNLEILNISYNEIDQVTYDMFEGLTSLRLLLLGHNSIKILLSGCLRDLKLLQELDLSYNKLETVPFSVLDGTLRLRRLDLSYNNINRLDVYVFDISSHTNLREINVNNNHLNCFLLRGLSRHIPKLTSGNSFNVSNVNGIPCTETADFQESDPAIFSAEGMSMKVNVMIVLIFLIIFTF